MTTIAFIGAGSVGVHPRPARRPPALPRAGRRDHRAARHRPRAARAPPRRSRARSAAQLGAKPDGHRPRRPPRGARRRRLRRSTWSRSAGIAATRDRLRGPGPVRAAPDHRRHARHRRHLPGAAHLPGAGRHRRRHARGLPGRLAAQLHQPDGDEHLRTCRSGAAAQGGRAVPLASTGRSHGLCELVGVPLEEVDYASAGVNHQAWLLRWEHDGAEPLPAAGRADRRRPASCAGGSASTCTAGSATTRPRPASTPRSTCRGTCTHDARGRAAAHPGRRLPRHQRGERRRVRGRPARAGGRRAPAAGDAAPPSTHRRSSTRMVTGTPATIHANVANTGPDRQPAAGRRGRGARARRRPRRAPACTSVRLPPQCAALNRAFLSRGRADGPRRPGGRPAAGTAGRDARPEHVGDAARRRRSGSCATP